MANIVNLPRQNSAIAGGEPVTREWYNYFRRLEDRLAESSSTTIIGGTSSVVTMPYVEKTIVDATTARTLSSGDANSLIEFTNASAITVTIPASSGYPTDAVTYFKQSNTGQVTLVAGVGVTIETSDSLKTRTQESVIGAKQTGVNVWSVVGDVEPVAPALSVLARAVNSVGAPEWVESTTNGEVLTRVAGTIAWATPSGGDTPLDTTLSYIGDKLDVVTTSAGTKTMGYTGDKLTSITGTGIYPSKTFSYTGDLLTGIDVL